MSAHTVIKAKKGEHVKYYETIYKYFHKIILLFYFFT